VVHARPEPFYFGTGFDVTFRRGREVFLQFLENGNHLGRDSRECLLWYFDVVIRAHHPILYWFNAKRPLAAQISPGRQQCDLVYLPSPFAGPLGAGAVAVPPLGCAALFGLPWFAWLPAAARPAALFGFIELLRALFDDWLLPLLMIDLLLCADKIGVGDI
jgi:hypothetical protein